TTLLAAYAQNGNLQLSKRLFDEMPVSDTVSWTSMVAAFTQNATPRDALSTYYNANMVDRCSSSVFASVLIAYSALGKLESVYSCFRSLTLDYGVTPSFEHFSCMIDVLARSSELEQAKDLIHNMPYTPHILDWRCFLAACRYQSDIGSAETAVHHLIQSKMNDGSSYIMFANMLA
ncbi:hypothetical protein SELMODRAFT_72294, partial [Selaginella moellendorffii]